MNVYRIGFCEHCGKPTTFEEHVVVHGAENLEKAMKMLEKTDIFSVMKKFCAFCGDELPCKCSNPSPQWID